MKTTLILAKDATQAAPGQVNGRKAPPGPVGFSGQNDAMLKRLATLEARLGQ